MPPDSIVRLVAAARRRITEMRLARRSLAAIGIVAAAGSVLLAVARRVVMPWAEPMLIAAAAVAIVGVVGWTLRQRPSARHAAIQLDHRLGGKDQVSTALELSAKQTVTPVEAGQLQRAAAWAEGRSLTGFGSVWPPRRLALLTAVAVVAAIVLAVPPSPADAEQARRAEIAALVDDAIAQLDEAARATSPIPR